MELNSPRIIFNIGYHSKQPSKNWSEQRKATYQKQRDFYSCKTTNENILDYCSRSCDKKKDEDKKPGLFSADGEMTKEDMQKMKETMQNTNSNIWHGVISFTEDFGTRAVPTKTQAKEFLQSQMKRFFSQTHLDPKNVEWFASYHNDTSNNHIHVVFFEKQPMTIDRNGKVDYTHKGDIAQNALLGTLLDFEEYFHEKRYDIFTQRDMLLSNAKETSINSKSYIEISKLAAELPKCGKLSYNSENMKEHKHKIDKIVALLLSENPELKKKYMGFCEAVDSRQKRYVEYAKRNRVDSEHLKIAQFENLRNDINARLGSIVINLAKDYRHKEKAANAKIQAESKRLKDLRLAKMDKSKKKFSTAKKASKIARNSILKVMKRMLMQTSNQNYLADLYERLEEIKYEQERNLEKGGDISI